MRTLLIICIIVDVFNALFFLAFCFGHLIHSSLLLAYQLIFIISTDDEFYACASVPTFIVDLVYPIYSFFLIYFLFKYSNVSVLRSEINSTPTFCIQELTHYLFFRSSLINTLLWLALVLSIAFLLAYVFGYGQL